MIDPAAAKKTSAGAFAFLATVAVVAVVYARSGPPMAVDTATSTVPIAIYCERTVSDEEKYKADWTAFSNYIFEGTPGLKAAFSVMDKVAEHPSRPSL